MLTGRIMRKLLPVGLVLLVILFVAESSAVLRTVEAAQNGIRLPPCLSDDGEVVSVAAGCKIGIGTDSPITALHVQGTTTTAVLQITGGADLAEPFDIAGGEAIEPGMVVAIDPNNSGQLRVATKAYDRTVAGVISGAGGIQPGIVMQQEEMVQGKHTLLP